MHLGGSEGQAGLPQCVKNTIGKGTPLSSLQSLPDKKDCLVAWFWQAGLVKGYRCLWRSAGEMNLLVIALLLLQVCSMFLLYLNVADLQRTKDHLSTFFPNIAVNLASILSFLDIKWSGTRLYFCCVVKVARSVPLGFLGFALPNFLMYKEWVFHPL